MLLKISFASSWRLMTRTRIFRSRSPLMALADDEEEANTESEEPVAPRNDQQQMGVVSYDDADTGDMFAREDLPFEKLVGGLSKKKDKKKDKGQAKGEFFDESKASAGVPRLGGKEKSLEERLQEAYENNLNRPREDGWIENPDRPTGYGIPDENDNEEDMRKQMEEDMASGKYVPDESVPDGYMDEFVRFLRDTYIGSPYDSKKKQQARYVIRNITGISVGIGIVFTAIWYLSPTPFITTAKGRDYQAVYRDTEYYRAPNGLMNDDLKSSNDYIDEGAPPAPQTRFDGMDRPGRRLAPKPQIDL